MENQYVQQIYSLTALVMLYFDSDELEFKHWETTYVTKSLLLSVLNENGT